MRVERVILRLQRRLARGMGLGVFGLNDRYVLALRNAAAAFDVACDVDFFHLDEVGEVEFYAYVIHTTLKELDLAGTSVDYE